MRTTIIIPDELMEKVRRLSNQRSKTRAVVAALETFVKLKGQEEVRGLRGKVAIEYDWRREEAAELEDQLERERTHGGGAR